MIQGCNFKGMSIFILIFLLSVILIVSCKPKSRVGYDEFYWKFHHTIQRVDTASEDIDFSISDRRITKQEIDTLMIILKKWGWEHSMANDSTLFIRKYGNDIISNMRVLDDELYRRMKDTTNRLIYH